MILPVEIQGVPCLVRVIRYQAEVPAITWGPMDWADPGSPAEIEFEVLDLQGRPDPALQAQMDDMDTRAVEQEVIAAEEAEEQLAQESEAEERHVFGETA